MLCSYRITFRFFLACMIDFCSSFSQEEFAGKGANVQLGPGLCIARIPENGRNFEYLSGEDPFLGYTLVQPAIKGIQSKHVIANAKHYVLNSQVWIKKNVSIDTKDGEILYCSIDFL